MKKINVTSFSSLHIVYETEIPIEKKETLRKEVDEVWLIFQKEAESAEVTTVIIQATSCRLGGLVREEARYAFVLSERDGKWRRFEEDWFKEGK